MAASSTSTSMFACTQCGIAFFYTAKHLQKHYNECSSNRRIRDDLSSLQEGFGKQETLLQQMSESLSRMMTMITSLNENCVRPKPRRGRMKRVIEDGVSSVTCSSSPEISLDVQLARAVAYFRKRSIQLPVSEENVKEVESLLNEMIPEPEITFSEFQESVREDIPFIQSLFSEFTQFLQESQNEKEKDAGHHHHRSSTSSSSGDVFSMIGLSATDVTASLAAAGGAHQLLLTKFLQIFHDGFETHRFRFPVVIFHVGKRKVLRLAERLFGLRKSKTSTKQSSKKRKFHEWVANNRGKAAGEEDEEEEEGEEEDDEEEEREEVDVDDICCFPFFVFVDRETGWKIMKYVDHVYPLFSMIQTTILLRGMADTEEMMVAEEMKVSQVVQSLAATKDARTLMITKKMEAVHAERSHMVAKLSETVVQFILCFRTKFFEAFLQELYDAYSVDVSALASWTEEWKHDTEEQEQDEQTAVLSTVTPASSVRKEKRAKQTTSVYVYDEDDELILDEEE